MYEFDASSHEERDDFARYVDDMSSNSVTVCDTTYTCRRLANGSFWSSDPKHEAEPESRECRLDVLAAAAHANRCDVRKTLRSTPEGCMSERPMLKDGADRLVQLRGDDTTTEMPSLLEGGWRCLANPRDVTVQTHRAHHMERVGGLTFVHLQQRDPAEVRQEEKEVSPAEAPSATAPEEAPVEAPPAVAPVKAPAKAPREASWTRCSSLPPPRPQAAACAVDHDCAISDAQYKEILWAHVRTAKAGSFPALLRHIRENVSSDIEWSDTPLARERLTTRTQMKNALMKMYDTDAVFRESVASAVDGDAEFSERRAGVVRGACDVQAGRCRASTVTPRTRLFDGRGGDVVFTVLDDDATVTYTTASGVSREVDAIKCTPATQELCDRATEVDGTTLRAGTTPVTGTYRIRASDASSEFVVMNHLSARDATRCAARFCELNQTSCPSSTCTVDGERRCVPK